MELRISKQESSWVANHRPIYSAISGQVLALEFDNNKASDEINQVFIIDQTPSVILLKQTEDQTESYEILKKVNISDIDQIKKSLDTLLRDDYSRASISERCLMIQGKTFVYSSGH